MFRKETVAALSVAALLGIFYFIPESCLNGIIPEAVTSHRTGGPLLILAISGIFLLPGLMTAAMTCSFIGDLCGSYGCFIGQMSAFAAAHLLMVIYFIIRLRKGGRGRSRRQKSFIYLGITVAVCLFIFAAISIVPHAPAGVIRTGCFIYAFLICCMLATALMQRNGILAAGALLFVFSDMILAWNKFVSPIEWQKYLIMVPYYGAQMLIWLKVAEDRYRQGLQER
ncbi:MAG: lysoplasmalogenase [Candidatus Cryptobacteroides sp.]